MAENTISSALAEEVVEYLLERRESNQSNYPSEMLRLIVRYIKNGDSKRLVELRKGFMPQLEGKEVTERQLQHAKYAAVATAAGVGSHLVGSVILYEHAASMIDICIVQIDKMKSVSEIYNSIYDLFLGFADLVAGAMKNDDSVSAAARKAQNYIMRNLHGELCLSEIALNCGLSASYLSALFKKETGETVSEYIMKEKLREAEYLLITGKYKISEICYFLNFCSQSYFTHCFKMHYGVTPAQYRRRLKE